MKILLTVLLFFAFSGIASAQGIAVYVNGPQQIMKISEVAKYKDYMDTRGKPCANYFMYKEISDQKIATFIYHLTGKQDVPLGEFPEHIDVRRIQFLVDKTVKFPTAEWFKAVPPKLMLIRVSSKDYKEIKKCLPIP